MYGIFTYIWLLLWQMQVDIPYIECLGYSKPCFWLISFCHFRDLPNKDVFLKKKDEWMDLNQILGPLATMKTHS